MAVGRTRRYAGIARVRDLPMNAEAAALSLFALAFSVSLFIGYVFHRLVRWIAGWRPYRPSRPSRP